MQSSKQNSHHLCQASCAYSQETLTSGSVVPSEKDPHLKFHPLLLVICMQFCPNYVWPRGYLGVQKLGLGEVNKGELHLWGNHHPSCFKTIQCRCFGVAQATR